MADDPEGEGPVGEDPLPPLCVRCNTRHRGQCTPPPGGGGDGDTVG